MEEIPTFDYSLLFSKDHSELSPWNTLEKHPKNSLILNGVEERVVEGALKGISNFFELTNQEERSEYLKKNSMDRIRSDAGENRENLKIVTHPEYHCPSKPDSCKYSLFLLFFSYGCHLKGIHEVELGLAKAISTILGYEETYIEKEFKLEAGFDVATFNLCSIGLVEHTAPGLFFPLYKMLTRAFKCSLIKQIGSLLTYPENTIFIGIGDHLEVSLSIIIIFLIARCTNNINQWEVQESNTYQVIQNNNEVKRISMATLHGPSLDTFVALAPRLIDKSHPPTYRGMTYKESLEFNGFDEIDMQSSLIQLQMLLSLSNFMHGVVFL
ncbi:hypothetical protein CXB51_006118 [Gossypium anomalum]|uniref:Uncharacterized protein n=1 Tax=Gossypium anomalum TaxID=47600 RepID=A0A8J6DCN3_9ROSI|nr:hypothetical protein CXB51_006118 [Gossypium anomalum]